MRGGALIPAGKLGLTLLLLQTLAVQAAEIKVIASTGVASVVTELGRQFEAKTGHKVQTDFAVIAVSKRKIDAGATFDIAILGPAAIDELIDHGKIIGDTRTSFGRTGLGVAARKGGAKPDISSAEAFKRAMLGAKSVGHSKEGLSGVHFLAILDRLGIAAEMKVKLKAYEGAGLTQAIATEEVELGVTGIGPILAMPSAEFLGALPKEIQSYVVFTAGVTASAKDVAASRALLQFMTGPDAATVFKAKGMERD
jgi:molybdate transport system substrate-binding protein